MAVDAVVYYRISNPRISVVNVENAARSTQLLAQTTLRNILGTKTLSEILTDRESISAMMQVDSRRLPDTASSSSHLTAPHVFCAAWNKCHKMLTRDIDICILSVRLSVTLRYGIETT